MFYKCHWGAQLHVVESVEAAVLDDLDQVVQGLDLVGFLHLMVDDLPAWIPPRWIDPEQRPLCNARVLARQQGSGLRQ